MTKFLLTIAILITFVGSKADATGVTSRLQVIVSSEEKKSRVFFGQQTKNKVTRFDHIFFLVLFLRRLYVVRRL